MKQEHEYTVLLDLFARIVESTKGTALDSNTQFLADTEPLAAKFLLQCGTIYHLMKGCVLPKILDTEISYFDNQSIIVLVRAVHELYLTFNFIYIAPTTIEEKRFRHGVWEIGAFLDRQKVRATHEEHIDKLKSEKKILLELKDAMRGTKFFRGLEPDRQKKALKGEWRLGYGWVDLSEFAGLDKEQFRQKYRFLSSYAHTGYLSIFQMAKAAGATDLIQRTEVWIDSVMGIISHFTFDYVKIYPLAAELFKQYPQAGQLAYINDGIDRKETDEDSKLRISS